MCITASADVSESRKKDLQQIEELLSLCLTDTAKQQKRTRKNTPEKSSHPEEIKAGNDETTNPDKDASPLIEIERDEINQNQLQVITSNNKRYKVDDAIRPVFVRYLASSYTWPGHQNTQEVILQPPKTKDMVRPYSTVKLHTQIAEELKVFMESIVALLILDPTSIETEDVQSKVLRDMYFNNANEVHYMLASTLDSQKLFPDAHPGDALSVKFKKLDNLTDIASMSGKVK